MGKTSSAVKNRYNEKAYDNIRVVVKKGQKEIIKAAADQAGESVNGYIIQAVRERMEKDKAGE